MAKIAIRTAEAAQPAPLPPGWTGAARAQAYFSQPGEPLHLRRIDCAAGEALRIAAGAVDQLVYVWTGAVLAGGHRLDAGSSLIVERGAALELIAGATGAALLAFAASARAAAPRAGGHVHLLPAERAPRSDALGGMAGLSGVMYADGDCPTCSVWLHANSFPGSDAPRGDDEAGVHSHSEDEIIFVMDGQMRLGARLYGPGTALAIAADTLYAFTPGPEGLTFINFRAAQPGDIHFAHRPAINEPLYWRERLPRPDYITPN